MGGSWNAGNWGKCSPPHSVVGKEIDHLLAYQFQETICRFVVWPNLERESPSEVAWPPNVGTLPVDRQTYLHHGSDEIGRRVSLEQIVISLVIVCGSMRGGGND